MSDTLIPAIDRDVRWSNSTLRALRKCERSFAYRWVDGLQPKHGSYVMERGSWFHHCLAAHHIAKGTREQTLLITPEEINLRVPGMANPRVEAEDGLLWVEDGDDEEAYPLSAVGMLALLTNHVWDTLPEDVRGDDDLPADVRSLLERYFFHHKHADYDVLMVEQEWERDGMVGAVDLVKYDREFALVVVVDHKTHQNLPDALFRLTDAQLHLYAWGIEPLLAEHGKGVDAVEFDYAVTRAPAEVKFTKPTKANPASRLYATVKAGSIDALTLRRAVKAERERLEAEGNPHALDEENIAKITAAVEEADNLYFKRALMPTSEATISTLIEEHNITRERGREILAGRQPVRSTDWFGCRQCAYKDICAGELYHSDVTPLMDAFYKEDGA